VKIFSIPSLSTLLCGLGLATPTLVHCQALETEESKPLEKGQFEFGSGLEYQTSSEGSESALPLALEYGITEKLTALIEPVVFTWIRPKTGTHAFGIGDLEVTLFYQVMREHSFSPSVSLAGEVKLPTAQNTLIGSGKFDYTPFLILSKTTGPLFTSINLGYTFVGKPKGVQANNQINYALGTIISIAPRNFLYAEVYGNTAATETSEAALPTTTGAKELSGGETVGAVAYGYEFIDGMKLSMGISYDNNQAMVFRPGFEWKFGAN